MGVIAAVVNVLICVGVPLAALVYLLAKKRSHLKYFLLGIAGFTVSQLLLRLPLLNLIQGTIVYQTLGVLLPTLTLFLVCLSAGLFEEPARYLFLRFAGNVTGERSGKGDNNKTQNRPLPHQGRKNSGSRHQNKPSAQQASSRPHRSAASSQVAGKKELDLKIPLFYGLGHGGIEAIALVSINNLFLLFTQQDVLNSAGGMVFLAGLERISAFMLHVALSFVVYYGIMRAKKRYLPFAVLIHTVFNFSIVLLQLGISELWYECVLLIESLILLIVSVRLIRGRKVSG